MHKHRKNERQAGINERSSKRVGNLFPSSVRAGALSLIATACFGVTGLAYGQAAQNTSSIELEEIVVTGIRSSLERSADIKRASTGVVDVISAEDIGKFPDINVAESLARVTGVAITRTRGGEGQFVTVRGLGEEFNAVTYNGRLLTTENTGREFSFDVIASELISGAEVYKSPTAAQGDGGLGGRVNIRTARPLDSEGFTGSVAVSTQYESLSDEFGPRVTALIGETNADQTFGWNASLSYQERDVRTDVFEAISILAPNRNVQVDTNGNINNSLDQDGNGLNDTTGAQITNSGVRVNSLGASVTQSKRERIGGTLGFEWAPSDKTRIFVDALYTDFESPSTLNGYSYFPSAQSNVGTNAVVNGRDQAIAFDIQAFALDLVTRRAESVAETLQLGFNIEHQVNDALKLTGDLSISSSEGNRDNFGSAAGSGTFYVAGFPGNAQASFDGRGGPLNTNLNFNANNVANDPNTFVPINQLTGADARLHFARNDTVDVEDDIIQVQLDAEWVISDTRTFTAGVDYVSREKSNRALNNLATQCATCGYNIAVGNDAFLTNFDDDFLSDFGGNVPRNFPIFTVEAFTAARAAIGLGDALDVSFDPNRSINIEEDVLGAYFAFDFEGNIGNVPYKVNVGSRFAYTDLTSSGVGSSLGAIRSSQLVRQSDGFAGSQSFVIDESAGVSFDNDYFDVLPSLNASFDLRDELKLRLGLSRSLSRPTLTDLGTQFSITSFNVFSEAIASGNPDLEAIRSNNFDLSLEWYGENAFLSAAFFYKDISDFVTTGVSDQNITVPRTIVELNGSVTDLGPTNIDFFVSGPQNGDEAEVTGLELGGQWFHPSGFGLAANITLTDSEATSADGSVNDLENISDEAYNLSVFYEANGLQLRASLNHRSDFLIGQTPEGGLNEFGDDFTQVDVSASYEVNDNFTVFLDGINITDEEVVRLSEFPDSDLLEYYEHNGTRWVLGGRYSF